MEQVLEPLERAIELTPILGELGYDERRSFNGLLQVTADGGPSIGESQKVRGLWYAVAIWVKDGPGMGKLVADWMTDGRTGIDHAKIDYARFYPHQMQETFIEGRCSEAAQKVYNPAVHPREPYATGRNIRRSPFYEREKELGGYFMELGGWERAHGYAANEHLLEKYGNRVPVRENEWDNRHFWRVSNAEHLAMSEDCGIVNLSHFAMFDVEGPDHVALMDWLCAARIDGDNNIGKGIYTHFLDDEGMVRADLTVIRMADRCRVIDGADAGPRDFHYMRRVAEDKGYDVTITDVTEKYVTIGIWGPNARSTLQKVVEDPGGLTPENFPFAAIKPIRIAGKDVTAFRISYVGEQGWELHMAYGDGLAVWDALRSTGVMAFGVETYANSRRMEKSLRLQNADLLTEYNLLEADLARPKVKEADFRGKAKHLEYRARAHQPAMLCTLVMTDNRDSNGVARYPVGTMPVMDPETGETLVDELGRRSFTTSVAYGPTIGKNIALAYLPWAYCQEGRKLARRIFQRNLPRRGGCRRLQAALRPGEPQAAELMGGAVPAPFGASTKRGRVRGKTRSRKSESVRLPISLHPALMPTALCVYPASMVVPAFLRRGLTVAAVVAGLGLAAARPAFAAEPVDVELILAVDVSLSMSPMELEIQRKGYAAALTHDERHPGDQGWRLRQDRRHLCRVGRADLAACRGAVDGHRVGRRCAGLRRQAHRQPAEQRAPHLDLQRAAVCRRPVRREQLSRPEAGGRRVRRRRQQPGAGGGRHPRRDRRAGHHHQWPAADDPGQPCRASSTSTTSTSTTPTA